jgi:hypothetical protein
LISAIAHSRFLGLIKKPSSKASLTCLVAAGIVCVAVYALIFTRTAYLLTFIGIPKYDLHLLVTAEPYLLWLYRIGFIMLAIAYASGAWAAGHAQGRKALLFLLITVVLSAAALLMLYPFDAADMFDYIMHGRMLAIYGANPYVETPADYQIDPFYAYVGWTGSTSPYGPFWLQLSALTARLSGNSLLGNVLSFKLLGGMFYLVSVVFVGLILQRKAPERLLSGLWLFACNPLVLYETFGHGHNDITLTACLLVSTWYMIERHHTLAILALVTGALFKHVTLLAIPAALACGFVQYSDWKTRLRFLMVSGISSALLIIFAYQPFWTGWKAIDLSSRIYMYTTSLPAIIHTWYREQIDLVVLSQTVSWIAGIITILASVFFAWRATRERNWLSYPKAALLSLLFYLLVTCLWFQQWYMVWIVGLAALLPVGGLSFLVYMSSFTVMTKVLISAPPLLWARPLPRAQYREFWLSLEVMILPWLVSSYLIIRQAVSHSHNRKKGLPDSNPTGN